MDERRKTVLVQVNNLNLGGTQLNAVDFAVALMQLGYDSVLAGPRDTLPDGPSLVDVARDRGIRVDVFDRPKTVVGGAADLSRRARNVGADIVHVYGSGNARSAYWGPTRFARRPLVLTIYEMAVSHAEFRRAPLIVGTGYLIDDLRGRAGVTRLISPPVDLDRDNSAQVDASGFLSSLGHIPGLKLILVSRLDEDMKAVSVALAIQAIARSRREDLTLVLVGSGDAEVRLRAMADTVNSRLGRSAIRFAGSLGDPRPAYASADIALGMGGSAARALAFGRPLIVLGEFGWSEIFQPTNAAALFRNSFWSPEARPDAVDDLVRQIEELAGDVDKRVELGEFGRQFSELHFGLEAMASRLAKLYDNALAHYRFIDWTRDLPLEIRAFSTGLRNRLRAGWVSHRELPTLPLTTSLPNKLTQRGSLS